MYINDYLSTITVFHQLDDVANQLTSVHLVFSTERLENKKLMGSSIYIQLDTTILLK